MTCPGVVRKFACLVWGIKQFVRIDWPRSEIPALCVKQFRRRPTPILSEDQVASQSNLAGSRMLPKAFMQEARFLEVRSIDKDRIADYATRTVWKPVPCAAHCNPSSTGNTCEKHRTAQTVRARHPFSTVSPCPVRSCRRLAPNRPGLRRQTCCRDSVSRRVFECKKAATSKTRH